MVGFFLVTPSLFASELNEDIQAITADNSLEAVLHEKDEDPNKSAVNEVRKSEPVILTDGLLTTSSGVGVAADINDHAGMLLLLDGVKTLQDLQTRYQLMVTHAERPYLWFADGELNESGVWLQELAFDLGLLEPQWIKEEHFSTAEVDLWLTSVMMQLVSFRWEFGQFSVEQLDTIAMAVFFSGDRDTLAKLTLPSFAQLALLREAIKQYQVLAREIWPTLSLSFEPKLGQQHMEIYKIRKILAALGDLPEKYQTRNRLDVYDQVARNSVKRFQKRHGLVADGRIGSKTLAALQVSPSQRLEQLQLNFWRWLKLPTTPPEKYLLVNIPDYRLRLLEGETAAFEMRVIVGDKENQTPEMVSTIAGLTLNPTWTPPPKIIKNELLPQFREDYRNLASKKFKLVQGYWRYSDVVEIDSPDMDITSWLKTHRLVQMPGKTNPLGAFRFNIPNNQAIYLHDTPAKHLFRNHNRALSHGCVRIEQPKQLASYLISYAKNPPASGLDEIVSKGKTKTVNMAQPLPVFIGYHTAWVNESGKLHLFEDVYERDAGDFLKTDLARQFITSESVSTSAVSKADMVLSP